MMDVSNVDELAQPVKPHHGRGVAPRLCLRQAGQAREDTPHPPVFLQVLPTKGLRGNFLQVLTLQGLERGIEEERKGVAA